jgi:hypothetical protein
LPASDWKCPPEGLATRSTVGCVARHRHDRCCRCVNSAGSTTDRECQTLASKPPYAIHTALWQPANHG